MLIFKLRHHEDDKNDEKRCYIDMGLSKYDVTFSGGREGRLDKKATMSHALGGMGVWAIRNKDDVALNCVWGGGLILPPKSDVNAGWSQILFRTFHFRKNKSPPPLLHVSRFERRDF